MSEGASSRSNFQFCDKGPELGTVVATQYKQMYSEIITFKLKLNAPLI